ncbi:MAG TPA: NYN domain-containing protein [Allosphingosinicella sp.]|jgi:hypothetical protein
MRQLAPKQREIRTDEATIQAAYAAQNEKAPETVVPGAGRWAHHAALRLRTYAVCKLLSRGIYVRGAVYYDGFNLYHAIDELNEPHLKWCNFWKLGELICKGHATSLTRVAFCSAYFPGDHGKRVRHEAFVQASALVGVVTQLGHTTTEPMSCRNCPHTWQQPREKETDINVALSIMEDAFDDLYDVAFLVTADTDQAATVKRFKLRFPNKRIINVVPPGRAPSKHLADLCHGRVKLKARHLDDCALPAAVMKQGHRTIFRPPEYAPPNGWVHPDDRP